MDEKTISDQITAFSEWRGTVKAALEYIKDRLVQLHDVDQEQWASLESIKANLISNSDAIRASMAVCRERCDRMACGKSTKTDLDALKAESKSDFDALKAAVDVDLKSQADTILAMSALVDAQKHVQIKQGAWIACFGVVGGAAGSFILGLLHF